MLVFCFFFVFCTRQKINKCQKCWHRPPFSLCLSVSLAYTEDLVSVFSHSFNRYSLNCLYQILCLHCIYTVLLTLSLEIDRNDLVVLSKLKKEKMSEMSNPIEILKHSHLLPLERTQHV